MTGGDGGDTAPVLRPGQYLDSIGPGETRYYAADFDAVSTVGFAATAVPQPGAAVDRFDVLRTRIVAAGGPNAGGPDCERDDERFRQAEGADPLTSAVARIPSEEGNRRCDEAGRYLLTVERESKKGSDAARWPLEMVYGTEVPLADGVVPAQSAPEIGEAGRDAALPTATPREVRGGTGFNYAAWIAPGVWKDRGLPSQTLWYRIPAGWGQQVRYDVEFANEPTAGRGTRTYSYGSTELFSCSPRPASRSVPGAVSTARTRRTTGAPRWPGRARCRSRGPTGTRAAPPSARCTPEVTSTSR
ncbi:hypothetical protein ACH475_25585 [Streptomyces globisporus]|uniref:hypothetical protein n=1 Tax=Streptomyces globisporus TaxID=1908 RepID=UPI0037A0DF6C|nr:hypothetical protein OG449_17140 [Streptomyces globisporus]